MLQPLHQNNLENLRVMQQATRGWISELTWSPDGRLFACASAGGIAIWVGSLDGRQVFIKNADAPFKSVAFAPNSATLASGSADTSVQVWDLRAYRVDMPPVQTYHAHSGAVEKVVVAHNGAVVSGGTDHLVYIYTANGVHALQDATDEITALALSSDHRWLAVGSQDRHIRLYDFTTHALLHDWEAHYGAVSALQFHPDSNTHTFLSASRDGSVKLWDVESGQIEVPFESGGDVRTAVFAGQGELIVAGTQAGMLCFWDIRTGEKRLEQVAHAKPVVALASHPHGKALASGGGDNKILWWGIPTD
ncbi:MAG UNVERIFIED_CONTAM: WD40 repeat domain-containing protein [Anaerolineae bacterium]|jgi:WD40 repeat protein